MDRYRNINPKILRIRKIKKIIKIVFLLTVLGIILGFSINAINKNRIAKAVTYSVQFESDGGTVIGSQVIREGWGITKPEDPVKDGYIFMGWTLNGKTYDFKEEIKADSVLIANWKDDGLSTKYKITFDSDGGSVVRDMNIKENSIIKPPADPIKQGYNFVAWVTDDLKTFNFNAPINSNISLKAIWQNKNDAITEDDTTGVDKTPTETIQIDDSVIAPSKINIEYSKDKKVYINLSEDFGSLNISGVEVYRALYTGGSYKLVGTATIKGKNSMKKMDIDNVYYYKLRPYFINKNGKKSYGADSRIILVPSYLTAPENLYITIERPDMINAKYYEVPNATEYIFFSSSDQSDYKWKKEYKGKDITYEFAYGAAKKSRKFRVQAICETEDYTMVGPYSDTVYLPRNPFYNSDHRWLAPSKPVFKIKDGTTNMIRVNYSKLEGAEGYEIYTSTNTTPRSLVEITKNNPTKYLDMKNKKLNISVRAFKSGDGYIIYSDYLYLTINGEAAKIS